MYANSRMLHGLAQQGNAPKLFLKLSRQGVPVADSLLSALLIFGYVLLNYFLPKQALSHLIYIVIGALVLNWAMISLTYLNFRKFVQRNKIHTAYPALFSPLSNWICLGFMGMVLYIMWHKGVNESVLMLPIWIGLMHRLFRLLGLNKSRNHPSDDIDCQ